MKGAAHQAPPGCTWRPSLANPRIIWLIRGAADYIGSIEPKGRKWQNRDTGELFDTKAEAQTSVEAWA